MDDFLNDVDALAEIAGRRKSPSIDAGAIMRSVAMAVPAVPLAEYRRGFLAAAAAAAVAASVLVVAYAAPAWADLNSPFFAMDALVNPIGWLK